MKFTLENNTLTVSSETKLEAFAIASHYRILHNVGGNTEAELDASIARASETLANVAAGHMTYAEKGTDKRPWFACVADLGEASMRPYLELLQKITGYAGEVPEMPFEYRWSGLLHTHVVDECFFSSKGIRVRGFIRAEDWYGEKAEVRAHKHFRDYVVEQFGFRKHEQEYIDNGNGSARRNPNYLKHHAAQPGLGSPELWKALFSWWRANHATPEQEALLQKAEASTRKAGLVDNSWEVRTGGSDEARLVDYAGIRVSYSAVKGGLVPWEQFRDNSWPAPVEPEPVDEAAAKEADAS